MTECRKCGGVGYVKLSPSFDVIGMSRCANCGGTGKDPLETIREEMIAFASEWIKTHQIEMSEDETK